ncbi:uncharacterized protein LOC119494335 isoform X2 [Sebastes umbrosus]|uniref:uncharacterized protein LOC119494335 isoform X2 n=1 Tax=Sebastes umbrosus TaxID=72105 RepID=UPI00189F2AD1|nr:uncharacterized protein LOC119494335 isoform X2 [Sebastes umbrosus]
MAGRLLLVVLIYFFSKMKAEALLQPKLTVNPPVITETETVTLDCQTPSSVNVSPCYFHVVRGGLGKSLLCRQTLTGTELLLLVNQSSPAEVKLTCFYLAMTSSPDSDTSSIIIRPSLPPKLTVNPPVNNETDSVTLICQTPSSVPVSQCNFNTLGGGTVNSFSCRQTLTGTKLLSLTHQSSPAEVEVTCLYTVKLGDKMYPSPHSVTSSITIHSQKPQMTLQHFPGDQVLFICTLPGSANHDTSCNLYFGEASDPVTTTTIKRKRRSNNQWFCQFYVTIDDLLRRLRVVQQSDASCDYSLGSEPNSLSPRSDGKSLTDIVEKESRMTQTMPTSTMTTAGLTVSRPHATAPVTPLTPLTPATSGLTVSRPHASTLVTPVKQPSGWTVGTPSSTGSFISTSLTSVKPASAKTWILKYVAVAAGCGVTVGVVWLVSAFFCNKRRTAGPKEVKMRRESQHDNLDIYHLYSTIAEEPAALALEGMEYSTVQLH